MEKHVRAWHVPMLVGTCTAQRSICSSAKTLEHSSCFSGSGSLGYLAAVLCEVHTEGPVLGEVLHGGDQSWPVLCRRGLATRLELATHVWALKGVARLQVLLG